MKPNFALNLTHDGISLLHRATGGWVVVGEVALDTEDLTAALADLRKTALALSPQGMSCKIVVPNSQILYRRLPDPGGDATARNRVVRTALEGATPYATDDLVWSWENGEETLRVAVVARETLGEAEDFATEHRFNPVSFVAIPETEDYAGEPFFGRTNLADTLLGPQTALEPDDTPINILANRTARASEVPKDDDTVLDPNATLEDVDTPPEETPADIVEAAPEPAADAPEAPMDVDVEPNDADDTPSEAASAFQSRRSASDTSASDGTPSLSERPARFFKAPEPAAPQVVEHPHVPVTSGAIAPLSDELEKPKPKQAPKVKKTGPLPEPPPMPAPAPIRPAATRAAPAVDKSRAVPPPPAAPTVAAPAAHKNLKTEPATATGFEESAPSEPVPEPLSERASGLDSVENEADAFTVFGARRLPARSRNRPKHLGLILTALLVVALIAVGLFASFLPDDAPPAVQTSTEDAAPTPDPTRENAQAVTDDTDVLPEPDTDLAGDPETDGILPAQTPLEAPTALAEAGETDVTTAEEIDDDVASAALDDLTPPPPLQENPIVDPETLAAAYAATGIWPVSPNAPAGETTALDSAENVYIASIDPQISSQDAVALPDAERHIGEVLPRQPSAPAPHGTLFDLDERGLVRATPEGALTQEGTIVFLGRPEIVSRARPTDLVPDVAEVAQDDPIRLALAGISPRLRPEALIENTEKANLGGLTLSDLSALRPIFRPASAQETAQADAQDAGANAPDPTAPVVTASLAPAKRPADFAARVAAARASAASAAIASERETETNSSATRVTARVPESSTSNTAPKTVARAATVKNAINLRQINLMGIYGGGSDRRALVRLPSGRFAKVKEGDRLDGGRVRAISSSELTYVKNGRSITLKVGG
ncbi:hypothetical protein [Celeribacter arenosi]|uniref:Type IV pilus biogenesis n=1 Tax=Celeribacter arenosi TaxID=792649 RepID=A0ABP7JUD1_9RHOB